MKAILINPATRMVSEISIKKSLNEYYKLLNCKRIDFVNIEDKDGLISDLIVNDEFCFVEGQSWFLVDNEIIIGGNALLVYIDESGDSISTTWTLEQAQKRVKFV